MIVGSMRIENATPPAIAEKLPMGMTTSPYAATPTTIEGTPLRRSVV